MELLILLPNAGTAAAYMIIRGRMTVRILSEVPAKGEEHEQSEV